MPGSYEAYCLDEAVWYVGSDISSKLENAGRKRQKGEAAQEAARRKVLNRVLGERQAEKQQFADPAAFFS